MTESTSIKGIINCPLCSKQKFYVYNNARGLLSVRCANCGRPILLDSDNLTAKVTRPMHLPRVPLLQPKRWLE